MRVNKIKAKMALDQAAFGLSLSFPSAPLVEMMGIAGFDYVYLDGEHGVFGVHDIEEMCRAAELAGLTPAARVPNIESSTVLSYLDRGILGILGPGIHTAEDAERLVQACFYAPEGMRSFGSSRGNDYGAIPDAVSFMARTNREILPMALVEDIDAIESNLASILKVEHLDVFTFGDTDIAQSMGLAGQPKHPKVREVIRKAEAQVHAANKKTRQEVLGGMPRIQSFFVDACTAFLETARAKAGS